MTEIKVNESGQAFFDFDALEKNTSKDFVFDIQMDIKLNSKGYNWEIIVDDSDFFVNVYVFYIDKVSDMFMKTDIYTFRKAKYTFQEPKKTFYCYEIDLIQKKIGDLNA